MATFPDRVLAWLNAGLVSIFDAAFALLGVLPPLVALLLLSLATGAAMLLVVARTSNQPAMAAAKRAMQAGLFEIRLFNDDLRSVLGALGRLLSQNVRYLGYSVVPLAWMALPLLFLIAQVQAYYGYDGLPRGQAALVKAELRDTSSPDPTLEAPASIRVETPAVRLSGSNEVLWRIVPTEDGTFSLTIQDGGRSATKTVVVGSGPARRSPVRVSPSLADQLLYPSEPPLPADSPVTAISITYPEPGIDVLGWRVHWLIVFVVLSMGAAFTLAKLFDVVL